MKTDTQTIFDQIDEQIQNFTISHGLEPLFIFFGNSQVIRFAQALFELKAEEETEILQLIQIKKTAIYYRNMKIIIVSGEKYFLKVAR